MSSLHVLIIVSDQAFRLRLPVLHLLRAQQRADSAHFQVKVTILPCDATQQTMDWLEEFKPSSWELLTDRGSDVSGAVAAALNGSDAELATVMDPADLVCEDWFLRVAVQKPTHGVCWFPAALVTYGPFSSPRAESAYFVLPERLNWQDVSYVRNPLPARFVACRQVLQANPIPRAEVERGWGLPGWNEVTRWWWNCLLLASGQEFRAISSTVHYRALPAATDPNSLLVLPPQIRIGPCLPPNEIDTARI